MRRITCGLAAAGWLLAGGSRAFALNPSLDVSQYAHTAWKISDGFSKGTVFAVAQTPDGYLWLGTEFGLLRFDGVRTVSWQPPSNQHLPSEFIQCLSVARDGTLWIGTDHGLASWNSPTLTVYEALSERSIARLVEDREGTMWLTSWSRATVTWNLCALQHGRVECHGENGGPGSGAVGLFEDRRGNLWAGGTDGIWRWKPGAPLFYPLPRQPNPILAMSDDSDGSFRFATKNGIETFVDGRIQTTVRFPPSLAVAVPICMLRDRDGGLWVGTVAGVAHVHQGVTYVFGKSDGLSGDRVGLLFEDREGNVWAATSGGLDRFSEVTGATFSVAQGLSNGAVSSVLAARDGSIWAATAGALHRLHADELTVYSAHGPRTMRHTLSRGSRVVSEIGGAAWAEQISSIFQDHLGRIWVANAEGVGYLDDNRLVPVNGVPGGLTRAIVEDSSGLWVVNLERGVFHVRNGAHTAEQTSSALVRGRESVSAAAADPAKSGVWLGMRNGSISFYADDRVGATYSAGEGLGQGRVNYPLLEPDGTLWAATEGGLSRLKNGRVATLGRRNGLPCDAVKWLVKDGTRSFWLSTGCGLVRVDAAEMAGWASSADSGTDRERAVRTTGFDGSDGIRTILTINPFTAPAAVALDGRLWFVAQDGVDVIDTRRLPFNTVPPPVHVEQVVADRRAVKIDPGDRASLPALTRDLQIDYVALSLVAPEKNHFRYKLEGYDRDWQDAGNRRQAFYTNLSPRSYRFRVTASNNSGVWNETGASLDFAIAPAYYQTSWFAALSLAAVIALVWTAHRVRLRIVEKHEREISALNERLMKAQEQERMRIAGELHDGVMQQMVAVTMLLGTAKRRMADESDAKATIEKAQEKLIQMGTDLRQLSHDLHPPVLQEAGLPKAVHAYCEEFSATSGIRVSCDADESVRDLSRGAALALFRIVQEALGNAAKHAAARQIAVRLTRTNGEVALTVSDNGVGFDRSRLGASRGLGLITMRERVGQLNGTFEFESAPGRGTTINVVIPFR